MWTPENRPRYNRDHLRYPSDLTDEEWALVEPLIPPAKRGGRRRSVDMREVVNGLMYVLSTGCQWRYVPKDLPPKSTLFSYFDPWTHRGVIDRMHYALYVACRERLEREASPTACIIDSQSAERAIGDQQNAASAEGDQLIGVDADRIKGIAHQVKGALIQGFGAIVGNPQLAADGVAEQVAGKAQNAAGSVGTMDAKTARRFLDRWNAWVQVCDLGPMKRLAKTIMAKAEGILRSIATGLSNGVLEAINGNVQAAKRKAVNVRGIGTLCAEALTD